MPVTSSPSSSSTSGASASLPLLLSAKSLRTREQPISFLISAVLANPKIINLAAGLVDPLTLPIAECAAITQRIFADPANAKRALQYDTTLGLKDLRTELLKHIESLEQRPASEMKLSADHLVVTTGSQQALYLIGDALIDPGDIVIAAQPSYFVFTGTLSSLGARVMTVPMDEHGMDVEALDQLLEQLDRRGELSRVKMVYCTSYYQNPTGLTLSRARRPRMLEIVKKFSRRHRILILEDAAYRELRYDGDPLPSIKSFDATNEFVILSHTFSKPFAPGIKLGYSALPDDLLDAVLQQKGNHDFGTANVCQFIALESMRDGSYARHVRVLQDSYRGKRDALLAALDRWMPRRNDVSWTHPGGGLYVWLTLPIGINTSRGQPLFDDALDAGVLYVPGDYCSQPDASGRVPTHQMRLSFGQIDPKDIEPGIQRLARVIEMHLPKVESSERATTSSVEAAGGAHP